MRSSLLILPGKTSLNVCAAEIRAKAKNKLRQKQYENRKSRPLAEIQIGQDFYILDHTGRKRWNRKRTVTGKYEGRGYTLITKDGTEKARNRSHIMPVPVDYTTQDSDARPSLLSDDSPSSAEIHEDLEINQDSLPANLADHNPANASLRKSIQIKKEKKVCHFCHDCRRIETYLSQSSKSTQLEKWVLQPPSQNPQLKTSPVMSTQRKSLTAIGTTITPHFLMLMPGITISGNHLMAGSHILPFGQ